VSQVPKSEAPGIPNIEVNADHLFHVPWVGNTGGELKRNSYSGSAKAAEEGRVLHFSHVVLHHGAAARGVRELKPYLAGGAGLF